jgi:hypothetical protein
VLRTGPPTGYAPADQAAVAGAKEAGDLLELWVTSELHTPEEYGDEVRKREGHQSNHGMDGDRDMPHCLTALQLCSQLAIP